MKYIPIATPTLGKEELRLVTQCIKSTWVSSIGNFIDEFEQQFAKFIGTKYAISTANGTTALHMALMALGVEKGDEVIVPAFSFVASANAIVHAGATPVFIDIDPQTWNIDTTFIEQKITKKTKAIMAVHIYGYPADMEKICRIAQKYKLRIIEDAAEAHGASIKTMAGKWRNVGAWGDIGCFSFYGNKIITTGEGGMITTNSKQLAEKIKMLKNHGMSPKRKYYHPILGYNYRMTNLQAAVGVAQLKKIAVFLQKRDRIAQWYRQYLGSVDGIQLPLENTEIIHGVNWLFTIRITPAFKHSRDAVITQLKKNGIDSRPTFYPLPSLPMYQTHERFPQAHRAFATGLSLPSSVNLTKRDISYICTAIKKLTL